MSLLSQIINAKEIAEQNNFEIDKSIFNKINHTTGAALIKKFETESQIILEQAVRDLYSEYLSIDFQWSVIANQKRFYGAFTMIPLEQSLQYHDELITNYYESVEYAYDYPNPEQVLEEIKNFYPIFIFQDGNAFCLDKRNSNIVFYDHSVFEFYDGNFNGILIAKDYCDLIEKWSKILFLEQFWWSKDSLNNDGIDLASESIASFINSVNL